MTGDIEVPLSQIKVGQRIRQDIIGPKLLDLANSINQVGLLEPIVVREIKNEEPYLYELIAGRSRMLAFELLKRTKINIVIRNEITNPLVGEFHENTKRNDFSPADLKNGIQKIDSILQDEKKLGIKKKESRIQRIASETGVSPNRVSKFEKVYKAFNSNPILYGDLKSRLEAKKVTLEQAHKIVRRDEMHKKWSIPKLPNGKFDIILCDPIFKHNVHANSNKGMGVTGNELAHLEVEKCSADNSLLFIWTSAYTYNVTMAALQSWGFMTKTHAVLVENCKGPGFYFRPEHELLLVAEKGDMPHALERFSSVIKPDPILGESSDIKRSIYGMIERMYPNRSYLTMFSNVERSGWTSWNVKVSVGRPRADKHRQ